MEIDINQPQGAGSSFDDERAGGLKAPARSKSLPLRALPSLTALQAFERTAAQLSFRRAARDLALSPSAISHQIRNLEDHFGVRLFARDGRTVRLTREGAHYLDSVKRGLSLLEEASRGLMHEGRGARRELRISALPIFMSTVLIPRLADFERRHPTLALRIQGTHDYADFEHGEVDLAIRLGREQASGLRLEPILEVRNLPVCAPSMGLTGLLSPLEISRHVLIQVTHQPQAWRDWFAAAGSPELRGADEIWFDSVSAALDAAEHGIGIALAPCPLIQARRGFGQTLTPVGEPSANADMLHLVLRSRHADSKWAVAFRKWLMESIAQTTQSSAPAAAQYS
ncbi:LysR substrate-binding domain-containing protein [Caulobacter sp. NIBR2454]|uniref:LysR substrate-binding domain-containing protein n=1 Tax=Caulobacter sp. NIBR2454 TaxID=3015996 RepID=UPI0022B65F92|nr:LysR substrate-binding domain-containing protein [Caulobacter sp. NIBR2454]